MIVHSGFVSQPIEERFVKAFVSFVFGDAGVEVEGVAVARMVGDRREQNFARLVDVVAHDPKGGRTRGGVEVPRAFFREGPRFDHLTNFRAVLSKKPFDEFDHEEMGK